MRLSLLYINTMVSIQMWFDVTSVYEVLFQHQEPIESLNAVESFCKSVLGTIFALALDVPALIDHPNTEVGLSLSWIFSVPVPPWLITIRSHLIYLLQKIVCMERNHGALLKIKMWRQIWRPLDQYLTIFSQISHSPHTTCLVSGWSKLAPPILSFKSLISKSIVANANWI